MNEAWNEVTAKTVAAIAAFPAQTTCLQDAGFVGQAEALRKTGFAGLLRAWFCDTALFPVLRSAVPRCCAAAIAQPDSDEVLLAAAVQLRDGLASLRAFLLFFNSLCTPRNYSDDLQLRCRAAAFPADSPDTARLQSSLAAFFSRSFSRYCTDFGTQQPCFGELLEAAGLVALGEGQLFALLVQEIDRKVADACATVESRALNAVLEWTERVAVSWLCAVHPSVLSARECWRKRLAFFACEAVAKSRTETVFDALKLFPDSLGALEDLRGCLAATSRHRQLRGALVAAVKARLLTVGAGTADILLAFAKAVKALRVVDPSGVLLAHVASPIREYLRTRKDTVQCVVDAFVRESSEDISEAFRTKPKTSGTATTAEDDDPDNWNPAPIDAQPGTLGGDVVAMLEELWGGSDAFVEHYATSMAAVLLTLPGWDTDRELRQLEVLKARFGEIALQKCEVMIRDISESRRLAQQLPPVSDSFGFAGTIISHMYWPEAVKEEDESITQDSLPPEISQAMEHFSAEYIRLRPTRRLQWICGQGDVTLEVDVAGSLIEVTVSPTLAAFISCFSEKPTWKAQELAIKLGISADAIKRSALFWVSKGVLYAAHGSDSYSTVRSQTTPSSSQSPTAIAPTQQQEEPATSTMQTIESVALPLSSPPPLDVDGEVAGIITGLLVTGSGMTQRELCAEVADIAPEVSPAQIHSLLKAMISSGKLSLIGERFQALQEEVPEVNEPALQ